MTTIEIVAELERTAPTLAGRVAELLLARKRDYALLVEERRRAHDVLDELGAPRGPDLVGRIRAMNKQPSKD